MSHTQTQPRKSLRYSTLPAIPDRPQDDYPAFDPATMSIAGHVSGMLQAKRHELKPQPFTELLDNPDHPKPDALRVGGFVKVLRYAPRNYKLHAADENTVTMHDASRNKLWQFNRTSNASLSKIKPGDEKLDKWTLTHPDGHAHAYLIELTKIADKLTGFIRGHSENEIDPVDQLAPVTFKPSEVFAVLSPEQARKELPNAE